MFALLLLIEHGKCRKAILTAYGPGGKGILITRKSPREMFITKSGREILETFKGHHPFLDLIIASIKVTLQH